MLNIFFELDRLRVTLQDRGVDDRTVNNVVARARRDIEIAIHEHGEAAVEQAVEIGVQRRSPEFINELHLDSLTHEIDTDSGRLDFSTPPRPMLPSLLKNAKPMKDGSGFYKVIPVGKPGDRPPISTSIVDAQKKIVAQRAEAAKERQRDHAPQGSVAFRTATSKQDMAHSWVAPAQDKDFTHDVDAINADLRQNIDSEIYAIINSYIEMF